MAKTITLDAVDRGSVRISRQPDGSLYLEAIYTVKSGGEVVKIVTRDLTGVISQADRTALTNAFNNVFQAIENAEIGP